MGQIQNGLHEIWLMPEGGGYPILSVFNRYQHLILPGQGTTDDPYLISSPIELGAIYHNPDVAYALATSLDLAGTQWTTAIVPVFSGSFDGNGYTISHLTIYGGENLGLFGELESGAMIHDLRVVDVNVTNLDIDSHAGGLVGVNRGNTFNCAITGTVSGENEVGGLVGQNEGGNISACHSTTTVTGNSSIGGIAGRNQSGIISNCYSKSIIRGTYAGGIVGDNKGNVIRCYSASVVSGPHHIGGLVGRGSENVTGSFWDIEASGLTTSEGGIGLTTETMQTLAPYLGAGWDFTFHPVANPSALWWLPGHDYPRLWWQYGYAYSPDLSSGTVNVSPEVTLQWRSGAPGVRHDLYYGDDKDAVANANPEGTDVYYDRLSADIQSVALNDLEYGKTYYWRVDGVNETDPTNPWKGNIWCFTTIDFASVKMIDYFESYDDTCNRIYFIWQDGWGHTGGEDIPGCEVAPYEGNGSWGVTGNIEPPYVSQTIVHTGLQAMPVDYNNVGWPWISEVQRSWTEPQDWSDCDADALTLYFRGREDNTRDYLYLAVEDRNGSIEIVSHPDAYALQTTQWQVWHVPLANFKTNHIDITAITKLVIGIGNQNNPKPGAVGRLYIDDIQLTKHM